METLLWILGILFIVGGAVSLWRRQILWGIVSIVIGMAIGGFGLFS